VPLRDRADDLALVPVLTGPLPQIFAGEARAVTEHDDAPDIGLIHERETVACLGTDGRRDVAPHAGAIQLPDVRLRPGRVIEATEQQGPLPNWIVGDRVALAPGRLRVRRRGRPAAARRPR